MNVRNDKVLKIITHVSMTLFSLACLLPFLLMITASLTEEITLIQNGYRFLPKQWSLSSYRYLSHQFNMISHAYLITVLTTIVGTSVNLMITSLMAYPLSRRDFKYRNHVTFFVFFTMLFNGGLVPTYIMYTQIFSIKNTIWGIIVPRLLMSAFYVLIVRTYFMTSIPEAVIESARMDGATEFGVFFRIVMPMSLPILATVGILVCVNYWNEWYNGLIYITDSKLYSLQNLLNRLIRDIQFILTADIRADETLKNIPQTGVRMAIAVIGTLPILVAYPFFQKYFIKGIAIGAVKG